MTNKVENFYSTGEFANIIGVTQATLRNWDKKGTLKPHHRTEGGQRLYSESQKRQFFKEPETEEEGKNVQFTLIDSQYCFSNDLQNLSNAEIALIIQELQKEQKKRQIKF